MDTLTLLALIPAAVAAAFLLHWLTLRPLKTAEERLPSCRGAYLGLSLQLVMLAWYLAGSRPGSVSILIALGVSFSFLGDFFNLQFPSVKKALGEPVFYGILSFIPAQVCYISAYLTLLPWGEYTAAGWFYPLLLAFLIVPAVVFRLRVYNPQRPRRIMAGAFVYGFFLSTMGALAISAAFLRGGYWYAVAGGGVFFLLSDAVMGETTIYGRHPVFEYQIPWFTYLVAQGLIVFGTAAMTL
mgnify:CR=1 FL=1